MNKKEKNIYEAKSKVLKALGHPTRLWMAEQLKKGEKCVCEFVEVLDVDFSTISKHLSVLKNAGIVGSEKQGKQVFYHLKTPCVLNFINCIESVIESKIESFNLN